MKVLRTKKDAYDIYKAGMHWKEFVYNEYLDDLIKADKEGYLIFLAGKDWKSFDYKKGLKALENTKYHAHALEDWPKGIKASQAKSKQIKSKAKTLPMKELKLEATTTKIEDFEHWAKFQSIENIIKFGKMERAGFDYIKAIQIIYKKMKNSGYDVNIIRNEILSAVYKVWPEKYFKSIKTFMSANPDLKWISRIMIDAKNLHELRAGDIYSAGKYWKEFDYDKGLDVLIKKDKSGANIYQAGVDWKEFDYEKGIRALRNTKYYDSALRSWPIGIKASQAISKEIKDTSKKLPKKTLKLENLAEENKIEDLKTAKEIYWDGKQQKNFNFKKGLDALINADADGYWIYDAGKNWKIFNYKKGLNALIKKDKWGENIYSAGKNWKIFNYEKGLKALKNTIWYKTALKRWPKGIKASQAKSKDIKDKAKVLKMKPLRLKEEAFTEIQYLNKSFFYDLKRVFRAVKKMDKPEKTKRLGFYLQALRKVQGNQENIDRIIRDVFEKKQELSPEQVINKLKAFETPSGKKLYIKPETAYQTTQRLVASQKLNKTISVSIFGEIYDEILDKYKNQPGGDDIIRSINRYISGHFTDAAAFIRWTNMSEDWTHIDAFQTDFFSKIKAMGNQDENFKKVADEIRAKENEYWKTAMSYIVRTNPGKKVWTANTEDLVKAVENVRGEVKLKQYYHKLPKLLGFRLITMDKLKQILRTRPGEETEKKITTMEKAVGKYIKPKTASMANYKNSIEEISKAITKIAITNKKANVETEKQQIDVIISGYIGEELASAFHQHLDDIHKVVNKDITQIYTYLAKLRPKIAKFLKEKASLSIKTNIWWGNREMLFENTEYKNILVENKIDRIIGNFINGIRKHI